MAMYDKNFTAIVFHFLAIESCREELVRIVDSLALLVITGANIASNPPVNLRFLFSLFYDNNLEEGIRLPYEINL